MDSSLEFFDKVVPLINESKIYLASQKWCGEIYEGWLFTNIGYALCIFLYRIDKLQSSEDNLVWIVVGDIPPAYLDTYNVESTKEVIENYIELVEDWIENAESGNSFEDCFPFKSDTPEESITMLKTRIQLLKNSFLPNIADIRYEID